MKLDKKQLPQLIVLGVLVVICIGYVSFKIVSPPANGPRRAHKTESKAATDKDESAQAQDAAATATVTAGPLACGVFPDLASSPLRRDPFIPQKLPGGEAALRTAMARPPRCIPNMLPTSKVGANRVPPIDLSSMNPFGRGNRSTLSSVRTVQEDPEEEITVTGVVRGVDNVVILRVGKTGRHVVKEGQSVDGRYRVVSVTGDGAVLVYGNRRIPVKLGGAKNAN